MLKPRKPKSDKYRPVRKKPSTKNQANYDVFDLNKAVSQPLKRIKTKALAKSVTYAITSSRPEYIGQNVYIRPSYIVSLPEYSGITRNLSRAFIENQKNLADNTHAGLISRKAVSKMKNAVNWLLCSAKPKDVYHREKDMWFKFKINFITLTLPDTSTEVTDEQFKEKLVQPFLAYCRKYYGLGNYVWKLEFQGNGKLHLHLVTETFIHHAKMRKCWNTILGHNGLLADFYLKFGHANPNSTDVHSVKKIKNLAGYLAKYMSKQSEDLIKIKGRIWGCSEQLSRANTTRVFIDRNACHEMLRPLMSPRIDYKAIMGKAELLQIPKKLGELFFLKFENWQHDITGTVKNVFADAVSFLQQTSGTQQMVYEV